MQGYYRRLRENQVPIDMTVSHGNAIAAYFYDPDGNRCEVYWIIRSPPSLHVPLMVWFDPLHPAVTAVHLHHTPPPHERRAWGVVFAVFSERLSTSFRERQAGDPIPIRLQLTDLSHPG